jgi:hypothetical protein
LPPQLTFKFAANPKKEHTVEIWKLLQLFGDGSVTNEWLTDKVLAECRKAFKSKQKLSYIFRNDGVMITDLLAYCSPDNLGF